MCPIIYVSSTVCRQIKGWIDSPRIILKSNEAIKNVLHISCDWCTKAGLTTKTKCVKSHLSRSIYELRHTKYKCRANRWISYVTYLPNECEKTGKS